MLNHLIYGERIPIPAEIEENQFLYVTPESTAADQPNRRFRVLIAVVEVTVR
jgi:hypothetical protein